MLIFSQVPRAKYSLIRLTLSSSRTVLLFLLLYRIFPFLSGFRSFSRGFLGVRLNLSQGCADFGFMAGLRASAFYPRTPLSLLDCSVS